MNAKEYYLKAMQKGLFKNRDWVFSCFCLQKQSQDKIKLQPYQIVQMPNGHYYYNENLKLELIEGTSGDRPLMHAKDVFELNVGDLINVKKRIVTTAGNILFNCCSIISAFGSKIEFITGKVSVSSIEEMLAPLIKSIPEDGIRDEKSIYVDEYLRFCDSFNYLTEFNLIFTQALTEKAITQAPGTIELRNKLVEENKDHLDDPLVVAKIEKALLEYDTQYLKGDKSKDFLISKKSRDVARRKLFLDYGSDVGLTDSFKADMIQKSLSEGWQIEKMPTMINALRAGSYNRGAETQLGGEAVKWLYRASSNINILDTDCQSSIGITELIDKNNVKTLVGKRVINGTQTTLIETKDQADSYLGKVITRRTPLYCKLPSTDWCRYCLGETLGTNKDGAAVAVSSLGSAILNLSLKAFHSSGISTHSTQLKDILS